MSTQGTSQNGQPGDKSGGDTLDFLYEHTKDAPNAQTRDSEQLDAKIAAVFAAATVAIGFALRFEAHEPPRFTLWKTSVSIPDTLVYLALVCWLLATVMTVWSLLTHRFKRSYQADVLWESYRERERREVKRLVTKNIAQAYSHNRVVLRRKARKLNVAVCVTGAEGLFLVVAFVVQRMGSG